MQDLKQRVEEAYNAAIALAGKQYVKVEFLIDEVNLIVSPARLGRKVHDLEAREKKLVKALKFYANYKSQNSWEEFWQDIKDNGNMAENVLKELGIE